MLPLIAWAFWIGIYPKPFFDILDRPVANIVERVNKPDNGVRQAQNPEPLLPARLGSPAGADVPMSHPHVQMPSGTVVR